MIRNSTRFKPDALDYALIELNPKGNKKFNPDLVALIINESYTGSGLVMTTEKSLKSDQLVLIKVGKLEPMKARLVWFKALDRDLYKVGIQYVEED